MIRPAAKPPYLRIVDAYRLRIESGALRAGARLPSTRQVAIDFEVALATATKAMGVLAREGWVEASPRVGTVVARTKARSSVKRVHEAELSRDRIVDAAIQLADSAGLGALSMRGVAGKIEVPAMSLYRHVANKEDLLFAMMERVMEAEPYPKKSPAGWRAQLELGARLEWALVRRHPWLVRVVTLTRPHPSRSTILHAEWMLRALDDLGLSAETMLKMHGAVHGYIQGIAVNLESEAQAEDETGVNEAEWMRTKEPAFAELAGSGRYPVFARVTAELSEDFDLNLDDMFEFGLRALLDGFAIRIAKVSAR